MLPENSLLRSRYLNDCLLRIQQIRVVMVCPKCEKVHRRPLIRIEAVLTLLMEIEICQIIVDGLHVSPYSLTGRPLPPTEVQYNIVMYGDQLDPLGIAILYAKLEKTNYYLQRTVTLRIMPRQVHRKAVGQD